MILRRLSEQVKAQNWFAVGLDFLIVVGGVFIGIQVSNWNEARGDRAQEAVYLSYLADDLRNDIDEIDYVISLTQWRMSALAAVITQATGEPMPTVRATPRGDAPIGTVPAYEEKEPPSVVMAMSLMATFDSADLAYTTLVSTGGIRLLRNQQLARRLQGYDAAVRDLQRIESRLTVYRDELTGALQRAGVAWIDPLSVDEVAEAARNHPELLAAMKNFWSFNDWHLGTLATIRARAAELQATTDREASQ